MAFVLDCSVAPGFIFPDEQTAYTHHVKEAVAAGAHIIVPSLFHAEMANMLSIQEKRGRWPAKEIERCLAVFSTLRLRTVPVIQSMQEITILLEWIRSYHLTSYDAIYLYLACQEKVPLATQDKALIKAARQKGCYFEG